TRACSLVSISRNYSRTERRGPYRTFLTVDERRTRPLQAKTKGMATAVTIRNLQPDPIGNRAAAIWKGTTRPMQNPKQMRLSQRRRDMRNATGPMGKCQPGTRVQAYQAIAATRPA